MKFFTRWKMWAQLALLMTVLTLVTSVAIGLATFHRLNKDLLATELDELQQEADIAALQFGALMNSVRDGSTFLSQTLPVAAYIRSHVANSENPNAALPGDDALLSQLETLFRQFMVVSPEYLQIRFIWRERDGQELLRIDRLDGRIVRIPDHELQSKGDRYYVRDAIRRARPGQVYFSKLDLNQEFGEITQSPVPVIRSVAPVYVGDEPLPYGLIVINLDASVFFRSVESTIKSGRELYVVNDIGDFAFHPDAERRYATELGHTYRINDRWDALPNNASERPDSQAFFWQEDDRHERVVAMKTLHFDAIDQEASLAFIIAGDFNTLVPQLALSRKEVGLTGLALLIVAIAVAIWMSRLFTRRVRDLAASAQLLATGKYDVPFSYAGDDEVGQLSVAMAKMSANIKDKLSLLQATEKQVKDNANFLESIVTHVPAMVFVKDAAELRFVLFNRAAETITGFEAKDMLGKNDFDFFPAAEAEFFTEVDRKTLQSEGVLVVGDEAITRKDGKQRILHTRKVAIADADGKPAFLLGISEDVTERREAVQQLEFNEQRFRSIVDTAAEGIVTFRQDGTVLTFNGAAGAIFGYTADEVIGQNIRMLLPASDRTAYDDKLSAFLRNGTAKQIDAGREAVGLRADGSMFPMRLSLGVATVDKVHTFTGIMHDLSSEKEAEGRLIEARQQAEYANHAKSEFLATMSHELRTPLNAIIGYSEMLAEDAESPDGLSNPVEDLNRIRSAGRHLLGLINDVLDLSKIEAGSTELDVSRFSVAGLVGEAAGTVRRLIEGNANEFILTLGDPAVEVQTDAMRLRQIVLNLLGNAAKFTSNGRVELSLHIDEEAANPGLRQIVITVRDSGIGIDAVNLERIFDAFAQADSSTTREYAGTGLGLAITRSTCRLMGGKITVASELGKGSEFTVRLPAELPMRLEEAAVPVPRSTDPRQLPSSATSNNTILVIEDDAASRTLMAQQLKKLGWQVVEASSGTDGLKMARQENPCAIVLDVMMPELDGWAILKILKDEPQLEHIPVVLCTILDDRQRGFALGATDYLQKPVSRQRLKQTLSKYCRQPPCRLLIVEDDVDTRNLLRRSAQNLGWKICEAGNGVEALEQVRLNRPNLILLDLMMPELDGFAVVDAMQKNKDWRDIPIVVITAKQMTEADRQRLSGNVRTIVNKGDRDSGRFTSDVVDALNRVMPKIK